MTNYCHISMGKSTSTLLQMLTLTDGMMGLWMMKFKVSLWLTIIYKFPTVSITKTPKQQKHI